MINKTTAAFAADLSPDRRSINKTFLIDAKGEHLVLEEARFSPPLIEKLIAWMKTDASFQSRTSAIEVVNDQALSPEEECRLSTLRRLARPPSML